MPRQKKAATRLGLDRCAAALEALEAHCVRDLAPASGDRCRRDRRGIEFPGWGSKKVGWSRLPEVSPVHRASRRVSAREFDSLAGASGRTDRGWRRSAVYADAVWL